jgi:hypothetical protein
VCLNFCFALQILAHFRLRTRNPNTLLRNQLKLFNLVANAIRFVGRILVRNIPGREPAERLEDDYIEDHVKKYGKRPRGNPPKK